MLSINSDRDKIEDCPLNSTKKGRAISDPAIASKIQFLIDPGGNFGRTKEKMGKMNTVK